MEKKFAWWDYKQSKWAKFARVTQHENISVVNRVPPIGPAQLVPQMATTQPEKRNGQKQEAEKSRT